MTETEKDVLKAARKAFSVIGALDGGSAKRAVIIDCYELEHMIDVAYDMALAIGIGEKYIWPDKKRNLIYEIKNKYYDEKQNIILVGMSLGENI